MNTKQTSTPVLQLKVNEVIQLGQDYNYQSIIIKAIKDEGDRIYLEGYGFQFMGDYLQGKYQTNKPFGMNRSQFHRIKTYFDESFEVWNGIVSNPQNTCQL